MLEYLFQCFLGDNSILQKATEAKEQTKYKGADEKVKVEVLGSYGNDGNLNATQLKANLDKIKDAGTTVNNSFPMKVTVDGYLFIIDKEGKISEDKPLPKVLAGQRATEKSEYSDGISTAIIPKGFTVSNAEGEKIISTGLVIYDIPENEVESVNWAAKVGDVYTVQTLYNQFVWVPVPLASDFIRYDGYYGGAYNEGYIANCSEPLEGGYETESSEYTSMYNSVTESKGFYVARYEASQNSGVAESKQGKTVWNLHWGTSMTDIGTTGAVYKSKQMYTDKSKYGVTSTLIYGVEWDAIMKWISTGENSNFIKDSSDKGFYTYDKDWNQIAEENITKTGSNRNFAVNNIYDLAGNVYEWTMEAFKDRSRIRRRWIL